MGSTRSSRSNATNQIDSRQIHETVNNVDHRLEDSFNNTNEFDLQDESEGNISAGGNVTVESVEASIAASEAAAQIAEENRRVAEAQAAAQERASEDQRRIAEANNRLLADIAEQNRRIQEQFSQTQREQGRNVTDQSRIFVTANTEVSTKAIEQAVKATENAVRAVEQVSSDAFDTNEDNLKNTLDFLENDTAQDGRVFENNFEFLGETIRDANELSTDALSSAFKSTVGGLADEQQQTLLIGLGIVAALLFLMSWKKS